ncbi:helix-turn-helix domain-containing protein [Streptomyces sp. CC208A]|uniref:helix-turn-helix domain-containing protein n=1 Tax=Streptomyces sp. CC208A TaxID=3044573 RepID=UPI0024A7CC0D|nr:helix-turn-helix domain-containing protein [Streptomyces sp. CC208A]
MAHWRAARPTCRHGHPFPDNLRIDTRGWAVCRTCERNTYTPAQPDEIAIERAIAGDPPPRLTPRERAAAIQQLSRHGYSARQIAERLRCTPRTVHRARTRTTA